MPSLPFGQKPNMKTSDPLDVVKPKPWESMKKVHTLKDAIVAVRTGAQDKNSRTLYPVPKVVKIFSKRS
jgi:hypothetical protein